MIPDREFQIVEKPASDAQKVINQWRHEYDIQIVSVQASSQAGFVIIALWRTRK